MATDATPSKEQCPECHGLNVHYSFCSLKMKAMPFKDYQQAFPVIIHDDWAQGCPRYIRRDALSEEWAQRNHGQSLDGLAGRGGLDPTELAANIERRSWRNMDLETAVHLISNYAVSTLWGEIDDGP